jgi:hypothetical protein
MGIGATEFITKSEVRKRISREYPNPGEGAESNLEIEHVSYEHSLLGQAFDYLIRMWLESQCNEVHDPHEGRLGGDWTANLSYTSRRLIRSAWGPESEEENEAINVALRRADRKREQFRKTGMNANNAIDAALVYSGLDHNIGIDDGTVEANSFEDEIVTELQALFHLFRKQDVLIGDSVIISPDFGERSCILEVHGDFIVEDTLIDVKTTENPEFDAEYWRQLLAYYILNDIHRELIQNREDREMEVPYPHISTVGVYFARYGELKTVDVDDYLQPREDYKRFRAWFVDRAIEYNHDGRVNYDHIRQVLTEPYNFEDQTSLFDF